MYFLHSSYVLKRSQDDINGSYISCARARRGNTTLFSVDEEECHCWLVMFIGGMKSRCLVSADCPLVETSTHCVTPYVFCWLSRCSLYPNSNFLPLLTTSTNLTNHESVHPQASEALWRWTWSHLCRDALVGLLGTLDLLGTDRIRWIQSVVVALRTVFSCPPYPPAPI